MALALGSVIYSRLVVPNSCVPLIISFFKDIKASRVVPSILVLYLLTEDEPLDLLNFK